MRGKLLITLGIGEPDVSDHGVGKAMLCVHLVQPSRLLDLLIAVVFGLDVHRFDDVESTLDLIASLSAKIVIPGHGPCFHDVESALIEARARLADSS